MAYTPELDRAASGFVRRLAWAVNRPMTSVLEELVLHVAEAVDADKVCLACRDTSRGAQCIIKRRPAIGRKDISRLLRAS